MSTGCKSSHNGFLDVSRSNGGLRISGWIGQLSCLTIFSTSLSVAAFLRRAGSSMLESRMNDRTSHNFRLVGGGKYDNRRKSRRKLAVTNSVKESFMIIFISHTSCMSYTATYRTEYYAGNKTASYNLYIIVYNNQSVNNRQFL